MSSYITRWCGTCEEEWDQDVDRPWEECPFCTDNGCAPSQLEAKRISDMETEIATLRAKLADREARLGVIWHEAQLSCKVNRGTDYPVGWDDAMACITSICKGGGVIDLHTALRLAGWEIAASISSGESHVIRRTREADDE